jgi:hypothetical protein
MSASRAPRRVGVERHVYADRVGAREQILERARLLDARRQLPGALHGDLRIIAEHAHAERQRRICHLHADGTESHHPERAPRQLETHEALLLLLDCRLDRLILAGEGAGEQPRRPDVARRQQQSREHQLLHRVGIGPGGVEHRNAAPAHVGHRDVVDADARATDGAHTGGNGRAVQVRGTHEDRVRLCDVRADLIALGRQPCEAARTDAVQGQYAVGHVTRGGARSLS